jgi:PEP-CTERM motif
MFRQKNINGVFTAGVAAAGAFLTVQTARADIPYFNGFATPNSQNDFFANEGSYAAGAYISRVGSGADGIPASSGNFFAIVSNVDNAYTPGYFGQSVYTAYNSSGNPDPTPTPNGFYEATDVYVDLTAGDPLEWLPPAAGYSPAFWIDSSPAGDAADASYTAPNGGIDFRAEENFRISVPTAGTALISGNASYGPYFATINQTGWYTFLTTFAPGSGGYVQSTLSVINSSNDLLVGSATFLTTMPYADLGGTGYGDWFTVWQNGFANDQLAIDNVQTGDLPEPGSLGLLAVGGLGLLLRGRKKKAKA